MSRIEQYSRLKHHRLTTSGQTFTIPTSEDHTDETWLPTDLYIGEIGINLTDDKAYFRTNNGIVQFATGTSSSGSTSSTSQIWSFSSPNIIIGTTYSADSVSPRSGYYTDLGTSTLRWKDLYLGGSSTGYSTIDVNGGLVIKGSANNILTTDGIVSSNAPIEINSYSSNANKDQVLWLNTRFGSANGSSNYITVASVNTIGTSNNAYVFAAAGTQVSFEDGLSYVSHIGRGRGRSVYEDDMHVVGGKHAVKGIDDDGSGQYNKSEWITSQSRLSTSDATITDIVNIPWTATASGGEIIQFKAYIIGTIIDQADYVFSAEVLGCYSIDSGLVVYEAGAPILNVLASGWSVGFNPDVETFADNDGVYIKVKGIFGGNIQWLCSYSYHRMIAIY
jgi:hypothetical protein